MGMQVEQVSRSLVSSIIWRQTNQNDLGELVITIGEDDAFTYCYQNLAVEMATTYGLVSFGDWAPGQMMWVAK